jgi:hypothetical protein
MKTCPKCGTQNSDSQTFCPRCESGGKTCPNGKHTMDPAWAECVYCKQEKVTPWQSPAQSVRAVTVAEGLMPMRGNPGHPVAYREDSPLPPRQIRSINSAAGSPVPVPSQHSTHQQSRARTHTEFRPLPNLSPETAAVNHERKVVGILVSYTWVPEGHIYPVREGRNFIGREKDCEICVPEDKTLSARNSHITYRQNFVVGDMVSMTGTDVDGVPIEEQFRSLANYATIRAGSTYFTFVAIKPPAVAAPKERGSQE